jgi:signal transduction histidine kinase
LRNGARILHSNILILTDDGDFARLLSASFQSERRHRSVAVANSQNWDPPDPESYDLLVIGPVSDEKLARVIFSVPRELTAILCMPTISPEAARLGSTHPHLLHFPLRDNWMEPLLLLANESLRRAAASRQARQALLRAAQSENEAVLGRYILEMKHSVNNALTSIIGNTELLLLEPGQLSAQSLGQIKTVHHMSLRLNEVMQRFSSLASEIRDTETPSHPETQAARQATPSRP